MQKNNNEKRERTRKYANENPKIEFIEHFIYKRKIL